MAINMDSFHTAFNKLDINLRNQLYEMINGDTTNIISTITEQIRDKFPIREDYIENFVQEHFIQPMEYFQNSLADLVVEKTDIITKVIAQDSEMGKRNIESRLAALMNEISREFNGANLEGIKSDFMSSLPSFLYRYGTTDFFEAELDESKVDEVRSEVGTYLSRLIERYIEDTKSAIQRHTTEYRESLSVEQKVEFTIDDIKNRIFVGMMSNYRLKKVEGNYAFIDSTTNEVIPVTKTGAHTIKSLDGNLEFSYGNKEWAFTEGNNVTTLSTTFVALGTVDNPHSMRIELGFDTATFMYNGEKTEDPETIVNICEEFKRKSPQIYERDFIKNQAIAAIEENARKQIQAKQEEVNNNAAMFVSNTTPEREISNNAAMFKTGNVIEKPAENNAAMFKTDEAGYSDDYVSMVAEIETTPDRGTAEELPSIITANDSEITQSEIDDRLFELAQDPKVQEYISLMKKAEELKNSQSLPEGIIL